MENVKTAISIRRSLFEQAEELARRMKVSRSGLFTLALEDYIRRQQNRELLASLNAAYADGPTPPEVALLRESRESYARHLEDEW
jgi:metal-responsive CopG/Arc/MetJ family transcriptional regulator